MGFLRKIIVTLEKTDEVSTARPLLSRCLVSAIFVSHSIRRDTIFIIYISESNRAIVFDPEHLRNLRPDEQSLKGIWRKIEKNLSDSQVGVVHSGVYVKPLNRAIPQCSRAIVVGSRGPMLKDILKQLNPPFTLLFRISGSLPPCESVLEARASVRKLPVDSAIVIANNEIDRFISRSFKL